jgi:hypothetical protein
MNTTLNTHRVLGLLAAVLITLIQVAVFAQTTTTLVA